ncbi:MAG: alpha/beta fold hydrolase, partial [Halanaeroarchaeum sp.]
MNGKQAALGVLGAGLVTAGANRFLSDRAGALPQPVPGTAKTFTWRGNDVSFVDAGEESADDVVLLHGFHAAASAREFQGIVGSLASRYRVLVPDLPGFGRSERPPVRYTGSMYEGFIRDFLAETAETPIVVASSLTGSLLASTTRGSSIEAVVLVNPTDETNGHLALTRE